MDLTRTNEFSQKKMICLFAGLVKEGTEKGQIAAVDDDLLLANLPPDAIITDAYVHVITASDGTTAAATLGTTEGGSEIMSAGDLAATGKSGTFTGQSLTTTGKQLWLGVAYTGSPTAVGEYIVVVEYLEYEKNTGEYTKITNS